MLPGRGLMVRIWLLFHKTDSYLASENIGELSEQIVPHPLRLCLKGDAPFAIGNVVSRPLK